MPRAGSGWRKPSKPEAVSAGLERASTRTYGFRMRYHAPAADRNKGPILDVLKQVVPRDAYVLELASGSGQHALFFSSELSGVRWQPSDLNPEAIASIKSYRAESDPERFLDPILVDASNPPWGPTTLDAILCVNMIHISPWSASIGLFGGGAQSLKPGGVLVTYGPYRFGGVFTAPSNQAFDEDLKRRNPEWGVRDVNDLERVARERGFVLESTHSLPANNHLLVWRLQG